jgi:hypothetical protein
VPATRWSTGSRGFRGGLRRLGWSLSASDELDDASVDATAIEINDVVARGPSGLLVAGQRSERWWLAAATWTGAVEWRCNSEVAPETQHLSVRSRPAPGGAIVVITDKAAVGVLDTLARVEVGD